MKRILFLLVLLPSIILGQESSEKTFYKSLFRSIGIQFGAFSTKEFTYSSLEPVYDSFDNVVGSQRLFHRESFDGLNLFTFEYGLRKNIKDLSKNSSVSVGTYPALSLSAMISEIGLLGFGTAKIPLFIEFNMGNGATWDTESEKGFVAGIGIDTRYNPIFKSEALADEFTEIYNLDIHRFNFNLNLKLGYRRFKSNGVASEINLRLGLGLQSYTSRIIELGNYSFNRPVTVDIGFIKYLNY